MVDSTAQIDNSKAGKYAFALTGRRLSTLFIPRVSLRLPGLCARWAFSPLAARTKCADGTKKTFNDKED